ncbi:MAG: tripartite tricarboxylate transporter substrate binding protein [Pigmentiphaga sp.]|uniref:tripartite tricarboxylate transporter substrate binding protein n=1 Tax=Pigmentiphaga sp. TaxID=1977564 RepID=UPI0029A70205|nr:tripartite tricarboxylate transporter substrate binding protein [Pigmentiphaga sp.]MDX3904646.1 tripartite tricarboxylate transporter substrate binding protein [Pigmentiphaga sp.]
MSRTSAFSLLACLLIALAGRSALAAWPERPVTLVVPWPAGGATDILARTIAPLLSAELGQPVIVVNRAGATGNLGAEAVLQQPADGYNIFFGAASHLMNAALYAYNKQPLRYDIIGDFKYAAVITDSRMVLVVNPGVPANTLAEFVQLAKSRPGGLSYSSSGTGSIQHLSAELLLQTTGIRMLHVPYKGIAPSVNDLVAGVVDASVESLTAVLPLIKSGKLKAVAALTEHPLPSLPEVPTAASQGYAGLWVSGPQFVGVPKATPDAVVDRLSEVFGHVLTRPEVVARLDAAGIVVHYLPREPANSMIRSESAKWGRLIREANVRID